MDRHQCQRSVRCSSLNAEGASEVLGTFDPLNLWLSIEGEVDLDFGCIRRTVEQSPTCFHELVHCWQLFATTSGFLSGAICPLQAVMVPELLRGRTQLVKPLRADERFFSNTAHQGLTYSSFNPEEIGEDDFSLWKIGQLYHNFEQFNSMLDDPRIYGIHESRFVKNIVVEPNQRINRFAEQSLLDLVWMLRTEFFAQTEVEWAGHEDALDAARREVASKDFLPNESWLQARVGQLHIHEGQARFMELQLSALMNKSRADLSYFESCGLLGSLYRKAFDRFLYLSGLPGPTSVLDWRVHLFIVVCDYAMNPTLAYFDDIHWPGNLINEFHPGARFESACKRIAQSNFFESLKDQYGSHFAFEHDFMLRAYAELEGALAGQSGASLHEMSSVMSNLSREAFHKSSDLASPLGTLLRQHFLCMLARSEVSGFYCSPLSFFVEGRESWGAFMPPIISTNGSFRLLKVAHKDWGRPKEGAALLFPIEQLYSTMVRQLVSEDGVFQYDQPWIALEWREYIKPAAQEIFKSMFGVSPDEIRIN